MRDDLVHDLIQKLRDAETLYYRLVLLVLPSGGGKTECLRELGRQQGVPAINVGLELSRALLPLTERQRAFQLTRILEAIVLAAGSPVVLLDNIELLFAPALKQDPLRVLQSLACSYTLVVSWQGTIEGGHVVYGDPDHAEYRRYAIKDFLVVGTAKARRSGEEST